MQLIITKKEVSKKDLYFDNLQWINNKKLIKKEFLIEQ